MEYQSEGILNTSPYSIEGEERPWSRVSPFAPPIIAYPYWQSKVLMKYQNSTKWQHRLRPLTYLWRQVIHNGSQSHRRFKLQSTMSRRRSSIFHRCCPYRPQGTDEKIHSIH